MKKGTKFGAIFRGFKTRNISPLPRVAFHNGLMNDCGIDVTFTQAGSSFGADPFEFKGSLNGKSTVSSRKRRW